MATIYRQYRPQRFADVVGQAHITDTLQQAIAQNRIGHAYLFQGPRGTGKTSTARIFAKRLLCEKAKGPEACGSCPVCIATAQGKNMDIIEIDAASNRGIDNIRALRDNAALSPSMGKYKIYIIDEVHMLSHDAFPALLKTLEEPVPHVIFILATTELHKVPQTILSRCQVYRFRRATPEEMRSRLHFILQSEKREADATVIDFIISRSDGCYRDAESLLGQLLNTKAKKLVADMLTESLGLPSPKIVLNFLAALAQSNLQSALQIVDSVYAQGFDPEQFIQESTRTARDLLVEQALHADKAPEFMRTPAAQANITAAVRALVQAVGDLAFVPQPLIALELAVLTVCGAKGASAQPPKQAQPPQQVASAKTSVASGIKPIIRSGVTVSTSEPSKSVAGSVTVAQVRGVWGELISLVKKANPVASTFLRAVEPMEVTGSTIILKVSYPLHQTFFEKPEQKAAVEEGLSNLLSAKVAIQCRMDQSVLQKMPQGTTPATPVQDDALYQSVKEVFGT